MSFPETRIKTLIPPLEIAATAPAPTIIQAAGYFWTRVWVLSPPGLLQSISADFQSPLLPSTAPSPTLQSGKNSLWDSALPRGSTKSVQGYGKLHPHPTKTGASPAVTAQGHLQLSLMFLIPGFIWAHLSHVIKSISAFCMNKLLISHRDWQM